METPVAKCPECGHEVTVEDFDEDMQKLMFVAGALLVHASMLEMVMQIPQYAVASEGFRQRVTEMIETMSKWVHDLQDWGEAFDAEGEAPNV